MQRELGEHIETLLRSLKRTDKLAEEIADLKAGPTLNEPEEGPPSDNGEMFTVGCVNRIAEQISFSRYYGMMLKALAWFID